MGCSERLRNVIYDTSILMLLYDGVDVFEEASSTLVSRPGCIVPRRVVEELERLASTPSTRKRRAASLALREVQRRGCRIVDTSSPAADDAVVELARLYRDAIPATADRELRRRLREHGIPHLYYKHDRRSLVLEC